MIGRLLYLLATAGDARSTRKRTRTTRSRQNLMLTRTAGSPVCLETNHEALPPVQVSAVALYFDGFPNSRLEHVSEAKSKRLDRRGSEAASFAREGAVIRDGNRKAAASHARVGGSEGTDTAGALPVHPAPTSLEGGYRARPATSTLKRDDRTANARRG